MGFSEELKALSANYQSPKIEDVKRKLKTLASEGKRIGHISDYDGYVKDWLMAQVGLDVEEVYDQRDGNFLTIKW